MPGTYDVLCLSHLRWDFVYQRPQHLLSRFARTRRVFFVEEPVDLSSGGPRLEVAHRSDDLSVVVPHQPADISRRESEALLGRLITKLVAAAGIQDFVLWYYTPMALGYTRGLPPALATVYDCMDELSAFRGAPAELLVREAELFGHADLVFTGGQSLYAAKRRQHPAVHLFQSSVDAAHFGRGRATQLDPADQAGIPHPRLGFFGVLDERFDADLVAGLADLRPDWHMILLGPVAKIEPASLPRRSNIHYLGAKPYADLPAYLAGWDVAMIPFARNEATRFVSPTKTPEYLAAGRPVVSTSIADVVQPYGAQGLARIADEPAAFVAAVEAAMAEEATQRLARVDAFLATTSWDRTWSAMTRLIDGVIAARRSARGAPLAGLAAAVAD